MNTIALVTWRRAAYTAQVLDAIFACRGIERWKVQASWQVEGGDPAVPKLLKDRGIEYFTSRNRPSINLHNARLHDRIFDITPAESILAIEDDAVLTPDALELAEWFLSHPQRDDHLFLGFGGFGGADPTIVRPFHFHPSPPAWLFTREAWQQKLRPYWNCLYPQSWGLGVGYAMWKNHWTCLAPMPARVRNIGRELGTNGTPEQFDTWCDKQVVHDGSPVEYRLIAGDALSEYWATAPAWAREYEGRCA